MPRGFNRWDEARLQGRLWEPYNDGLAVWFDALDVSTITTDGSSRVSTWANKVNSGNNASQGSGLQRPAWTQQANDGKPGLTFDGSNTQRLVFTALAVGDSTYTVVFRPTASMTGTMLAHESNTAAHQIRINGLGYNQLNSFTTNIQTHPTSFVTQNNYILSARSSSGGGDWLLRLNGVSSTSASTSTILRGTNCVGYNNTSEAITGIIREVLVAEGKSTDYQIVRREGYVAWKWGFSELLRGDHPFRNRPPLIGD